jgi:hypothetical protein
VCKSAEALGKLERNHQVVSPRFKGSRTATEQADVQAFLSQRRLGDS